MPPGIQPGPPSTPFPLEQWAKPENPSEIKDTSAHALGQAQPLGCIWARGNMPRVSSVRHTRITSCAEGPVLFLYLGQCRGPLKLRVWPGPECGVGASRLFQGFPDGGLMCARLASVCHPTLQSLRHRFSWWPFEWEFPNAGSSGVGTLRLSTTEEQFADSFILSHYQETLGIWETWTREHLVVVV